MEFSITVLPGDGVGPEVVAEGVKALKAIGKVFNHDFKLNYGSIGAKAYETEGVALSNSTIALCKLCDAILFGAVGDPKYEVPNLKVRPEHGYGTIRLRKELGLFANIRPVKLSPALVNFTNLKPEVVEGLDMIIVRELIGGIYFSEPKFYRQTANGRDAIDTLYYSEKEVERIVRVGFELARSRRKKLLEVDKFGILRSSDLWREVSDEVALEYPDVKLEHMNIDACAMQIIRQPTDFDVIVTENLFGDILSDEASMLAGSIGMMPSASLAGIPRSERKQFGLYEPIHGSAPLLAGRDVVNPIATILCVAMMLRYSCGLTEEADTIENAVDAVLKEGNRTDDIMSKGNTRAGTKDMGDLIAQKIQNKS
ncbi:3-isopropylmalate dehydrogenase [Chloroflexota bacterium]